MQRLEFIEIDIEYCALTYGQLPCTASGASPCFNTKSTCQARPAFSGQSVTLRFAVGSAYLKESGLDITAPCVESVSYSAGEVSIGENLGKRASLSVTMSDFLWSDTGLGFDKYHGERPYDPFTQGTFWGKFSARQRYLRGRPMRWIQGQVGQPLGAMEVRHFVVDNFDGPTLDGRFSITGKDILKLADDDRVKVPVASRGYLLSDINATQTTFTVGPTGVGNLLYPASGTINIAGKEICNFTRSGDIFTVERGVEGSVNVDHKSQDRVQICQVYDGVDPADIIYDLLVSFAKIPTEYIPLVDWQAETATFLRRRYFRILAEPMGVAKAIAELIQQAGLIVWWDESTKLIRLKVIRAIDTDARVYDDMNTLKGSFKQSEKPDTRRSQIMTYYGKRSPLERDTDPTSYNSLQMDVNLEEETNYGSDVIQTLHASWIPSFGRPVAKRINEILLGRFVNPPREFQFSTFRGVDTIPPMAGDGYLVASRILQSATGAENLVPVQVTKVVPKAEGFDVSALEMRFIDFSEDDLNDRTITIDGDIYNFNWRQAYNRLYPSPKPEDKIICIVSEGAKIGSQIVGRPAFIVGDWPANIDLYLYVRGRIQGKGGNGGDGGGNDGSPTNGQAGGAAFYTRRPVIIEKSNQFWGGGGGGGSGTWRHGGGGGGGQGFSAGLGGIGRGEGTAGTTESPGAGAMGNDGNYGGAAGQPGRNGQSDSWSRGGAAGAAIDGMSFLTFTNGQGDIRGPRIN